jgi:diguanylate cyclase (GGDEF)-like protein
MALLTSSAKQPLRADVKFAFEPSVLPLPERTTLVAAELSEKLDQNGSSTSLVPMGGFRLFASISNPSHEDFVLEIRHLRATNAKFVLLGDKPHDPVTELVWKHAKGGIAVDFPPRASSTYRVVAQVEPRYATVLKFFVWDQTGFIRSTEGFNRMGGALAGACTVLALTMGLLALRNKDFVAAMFGMTILLMLRIAAFNSGWDMQWLGIEVPGSVTMTLLRATLPMTVIAQTTLFVMLFHKELRKLNLLKITQAYCALFVVLLIASPFVEHDSFLRAFWMMTAPGAVWLIFALLRVLPETKDWAARLFAIALCVTLAGVFAEIAYMFGYWDTRVSASLLGVLFGSAINAAAVAERLYTDRAKAIQSQRREIAALREKEDIFQATPIPLFEFAVDGRLSHFNVAFRQFTTTFLPESSQPRRDLTWNDLFGKISPFSSLPPLGVIESAQISDVRPESEGRFVELRWARTGAEIRGSVQDVTDRELARQAMQRLINHDQLTGVLNVHGLIEQTNVSRDEARWSSYSLALVDLARFESINELFGHEAGDVVLKSFARRLDGHCQTGELVARVGADTFVVFFPNQDIEEAAKRIRDVAVACTNFPIAVGGKAIAVSVCVGVVCQSESLGLEQAIGASLRTTQRAKRRRSGAVTIALETPESLTQYLNEKRLLGRIADRLPTENFFQVMQPIVNIRHPRRKFAAEALIRMRADNGEIIPPGQFIAAAERNGMMPEIDRWTLRTACEWLNEHRTKLDGLEYLTVNVSGVSLNDVQFHADVRTMLADFPVEARKVCFEITESIAVSDIEATTRFTEQLRSMGARVALDDFGAGYTSFGYLRTIPAEILKIDGEIIKSVATDPSSTAILRAIRDIASDLGMRCVAEYVANFETLRALRELDIDYGQGFALCRPVDPSSLLSAKCSADIIADAEVVRYLDLQAGRAFTTQHLRMTAT